MVYCGSSVKLDETLRPRPLQILDFTFSFVALHFTLVRNKLILELLFFGYYSKKRLG